MLVRLSQLANRWVFRWRQKAECDWMVLMWTGNEFQAAGPATRCVTLYKLTAWILNLQLVSVRDPSKPRLALDNWTGLVVARSISAVSLSCGSCGLFFPCVLATNQRQRHSVSSHCILYACFVCAAVQRPSTLFGFPYSRLLNFCLRCIVVGIFIM